MLHTRTHITDEEVRDRPERDARSPFPWGHTHIEQVDLDTIHMGKREEKAPAEREAVFSRESHLYLAVLGNDVALRIAHHASVVETIPFSFRHGAYVCECV